LGTEPSDEGETAPSPPESQYNVMTVVKLSFVLLGSICVFVYLSDVLLDLNLNPIKQVKEIGKFFGF
jgi:hypothetical protein